jgi:succinate dehydrogenase/fumarate reductase iron-sulfur protein
MPRTIKVTVVRTNPETGMKPVKVSYNVPWQDRMRVMDALNYIRENIDSSLAFRYSCRYYAKCGTCAAMVNGKPVLTCYEEAKDGMLIEPLANFQVVRDLVVDRLEWDMRVSEQLKGLTEPPKSRA